MPNEPGPHAIILPDGRRVATGRPQVIADRRHARLASYLRASQLPPLPDKLDNSHLATWGLWENDQLGDCTEVARANGILCVAALAQQSVSIEDADVIAAYELDGGYQPGIPSTDNGCVELDVLNGWLKTPMAGVTLDAYVSVNPQAGDFATLRYAIMLFGFAYLGLNMPMAWQGSVGGLWDAGTDAAHEPGSWGGHATIAVGYDWTLPQPEILLVTWANPQRITRDAMLQCCDERYACVTSIWQQHMPPELPGVDFNGLMSDLTAIRG